MKLEVGMYVRTKWGKIGKITGIEKSFDVTNLIAGGFKVEDYNDVVCEPYYIVDTNYNFDDEPDGYREEDIIKASHNIIDLIEEGDYVNGERVEEIWKEVVFVGQECRPISFNNIKSIVTKEMYSSVEYRVEAN